MDQDTITITTPTRQVTIPAGRTYQTRRQPGDVVLVAQVAIGIPVSVAIIVFPDGSWLHWDTMYGQQESTYYHFGQEAPKHPPTVAQRQTLASWWNQRDNRPYGIALGNPVCAWAFAGSTPHDIAYEQGTEAPILNG